MMKIILKRGFNAFSGLHKGLVLLKDLPKPLMPNRTYMMKIIFGKCVPMPFWVYTKGLVLLKDLPKPSMPNRTYMNENHLKRGFNAFLGLHKGLVLLKDLSKPSMPNRTYMMKIIF